MLYRSERRRLRQQFDVCNLRFHLLPTVCLIVVFALPLAAQTGLPFSGVPTGGLGNAPGISWTGTPHVGVSFSPTPVFPRPIFPRPVFPGAVPVFFGSDEPTSVIINNIVPVAEKKSEHIIEEPPLAPLIIEREGNTWVRRRSITTAPGQQSPQTTAPEPQPLVERTPQPPPETTLVFSDGRRQNVATYTIFGGALYYSMPAWAPQQRVLLSALDLPATMSVNRNRGVVFRLPNSPNEVVTRP